MKFEGAMTALITPMKEGGDVDFDALAELVESQIAAGIHGLVAVGTTGESATLDMDEHVAVIRHVIETADGRVPVIAGAGSNSTDEAIELSRESAELGADGLLHVAPYYNKPTQEGMYRHFAAIAGATDLPVVLYNVPGRTSSDLLPETVARLCEIDSVVAIKEATGNLARATRIIELCGDRMTVLSGDDFTAFPLYAVGARGVISVVSNVLPAVMAEMWNAAAAGDWARGRALHYRIQPLTRLLFVEGNPTGTKAALALLGAIKPEIRLPMWPCSDGLRAEIRAALAAEGLL